MRMFFYTLAQGEDKPGAVLFMNAGVRLPTLDEQDSRPPGRPWPMRASDPGVRHLPQLLRPHRPAPGGHGEQHVRHRHPHAAGGQGGLPVMDYGVITFTSTYGAIYAQKVLRPVADVLTMPVLREISLGCGIAVRFRPEDGAAVRAALAASTLRPDEYAFAWRYRLGSPCGPSRWTGRGPPGAQKIQPMSRGQGKGHDGGHEVFPAGGLVEQGLDEQHHARDAAARAAGP